MLQYYFSLRQFRLIKWSFFIHSTTPYIHPRLDSLIEPKFSDCHLGSFVIFQGFWIKIAKEPYIFCDFSGGGSGPPAPPPTLDLHIINNTKMHHLQLRIECKCNEISDICDKIIIKRLLFLKL